MNYNKITKRTEQETKTKIQTDKKLNGLPNAGKRYPKVTDEKLTLNEHEMMIRIYGHAECDNINIRKQKNQRKQK